MKRLFLLFLMLMLNIGIDAQNIITPVNGVYDSSTGTLTGLVQANVPGARVQGLGSTSVNVLSVPPPVSPTADATAAIQALIDQSSANGAGLPTGRYQRLDFPCTTFGISGLLLKSNVWYNFGCAKFNKLVDGTTVASNSMLRTVDVLLNGSYYGSYDNIKITGGVFDSNHHTCPAQQTRFENVRDFIVDGLTIIQTPECPGWGSQIGGQRVRVTNSTILGGTELNEDGWHITHGDSIILQGLYAASGDDALAIGIDKTVAGPETWDNEGATNITVNGFVAKSAKATAVKIYYGLDTSTGMPFTGIRGTINNVSIKGLVGVGGLLRNGGIYIVDTTKQFCTAGLGSSATGCTLTSPYTGNTGTYWFIFDTGQVRQGIETNGSTAVTFNAISQAAGATLQQVDPTRIQNIDIDGNLIVGSALNDGSTPFGLFVQGASNVRYRGTMQFNDTPNRTLTFGVAPVAGAASGVLNANYPGPTNTTAAITFSTNNEVHVASLTNGSTAISWTPPLVADAGTTAAVNGFNACSVNEAFGVDINFSSPAMPHGGGCGFFNSKDIDAHDGRTLGTGNLRGAWEITGVRNFRLHDQTVGDIPTNAAAVIVQGVGSGDYPNSLQVHNVSAYKLTGVFNFASAPQAGDTTVTAIKPFDGPTGLYTVSFTSPSTDVRTGVTLTNGSPTSGSFTALTANSGLTATWQATNTRFFIQQQSSAGFVTYASFEGNDLRAQGNAWALDQAWNTSGTTPDYFYTNGNRGNIPNTNGMGTLAIAYNANIATPLLNGVGGHFTISLTGNTTIAAPTGGIMGTKITYTFLQDATAGRTVTWNSAFKFYSAPWVDAQVTTDANKSTSITFELNAAGFWIQQAPNVYAFEDSANDAVYDQRALA